MASPLTPARCIADEVLAAFDTGRSITPFSTRMQRFGLDEAYAATAELRQLRQRRGEIQCGRKIGFTNRGIWTQYGVTAPIWGDMFSTTIHRLAGENDHFSLIGLAEPRIEPEIVFKLAGVPRPDMDETELLDCIEWMAHGFEIVQSIFPAWRFSTADTVAAGGLHGALLLGPTMSLDRAATSDLRDALARFELTLVCGSAVIDRGRGANVLDSPLSALRYLVDLLAGDHSNPPLRAGEIVTTGTLTAAFPVTAGETWSTKLSGLSLAGLTVTFD
jgi:2-oxo-3-hexenedioate decarboxylase